MNALNAPSARYDHTALWTGTEMIVWGGTAEAGPTNTGGHYDPANDSWSPVSTVGAPSSRMIHSANWNGSEMIVWGSNVSDGAAYKPVTDTWRSLPIAGAPSLDWSSAVWANGKLLVLWVPEILRRFFRKFCYPLQVADHW